MRAVPYKVIKVSAWEEISARLNNVKKEVDQATDFVKQIEQGNLEVRYNGDDQIDDNNLLASSLISMRDRMKQFGIDEKQRNWTTEGLASFVDILRSKNDDLQALSDTIVSNLVRYMGANQGALYILNDDDPQDIFLEMTACYAYDRKKFADRRIALGEGMTGQVVLEKQTLYRTDIPSDFVKITSGLGAALPRNLIIVPLVLDQNVYGVMEIASFESIKPYQIEFVEKLGESIAATISSVKGGERTRKLLEETQQQAEQMRSQEEEMRQNMEELTATQEEMQRILKEVQGSEEYVSSLLNVSTDSIFTLDRELKLLSFNKVFGATFESRGIAIGKGFDMLSLYTSEEKTERRTLYNRVLRGETIEQTEHVTVMGMDNYFMVRQAPLYDKNNEIVAMAVFARDVTELMRGRHRAEELLKEAQSNSEALKAQEEELRQNMEELSATQEEMQRILNEVQAKEGYLNEVLNASQDAIYTVDKDICLISYNKGFLDAVTGMGITVGKGFSMLTFFDADPVKKEEQRALYTRALNGERYEKTSEFNFDGNVSYHSSTFCPLRNAKDEVFAVAVYGRDMTAITLAQKETERLSNSAQQQNEELKAQEEELRQNMEELAATQEEMQRILNEVQAKEGYLNEVLNASQDPIFTIDKDMCLISYNKGFLDTVTNMGVTVGKGYNMLSFFDADPVKKEEQRELYIRALNGERYEQTSEFNFDGHVSYHSSTFCPLRNAQDEVFAAAIYGRDVTGVTLAHRETERLANAAQQQNEELKAQEEELRQNMEELAATQEEMHRVNERTLNLQAYYNNIIEGIGDSIVTVDLNFRIIVANTAFKKLFSQYGVSVEPGESLLNMAKGREEEFKQPYLKAFKGQAVEEPRRCHFERFFHVFYHPMRDAKGEIVGACLIAHDITARTREADEYKARIEQLEQKLRVA